MKKGKKIITITIGLVCFILSMIMFMQFKIVHETDLASIDTMKETDLRTELANWKSKYDEVNEKYAEVEEKLKSYNEEYSSDEKTRENLEKELAELNLILGKTNVEGDGLIITLAEKTDEELAEDEEKLSIGAEDLVYIVNYLKDAGAEAISINEERVVNTTDIVDVGGNIKVNSRYLKGTTYIIKAIGNSSYLESAITGKNGYESQLETTGVNVDIKKQDKIEIGKYNGEFITKYIEEKGE